MAFAAFALSGGALVSSRAARVLQGQWGTRNALSATSAWRLCNVAGERRARVFMAGLRETSTNPSADTVVDGPFQGHFGSWNLTQGDVNGVTLYRSSLAVCAAIAAVGVGANIANAPLPARAYDVLYFCAAASLGVSLQTIHIYLRPMHNFVKALWLAGVLGSGALAVSPLLSTGALVSELQLRPELLLAVGWQLVALTGLFFKEAFCFGRAEAAALTMLVPLLAGGHFLRLLSGPVETVGAVAFAFLFLLFAARKFQQPARDDLGDKSVFEHLESGGSL